MLILNIQSYLGDREQAMELARLIADIEPSYRDDVMVLFSTKPSCPFDQEAIEYMKRKFPVLTFKSTSDVAGWPAGPNALFAESYKHCVALVESGQVKARAVMFIEADCIPLDKNWINKLKQEYHECGAEVLGHWITAQEQGGWQHINGNCIMSVDFPKHCPAILEAAPLAWDAYFSEQILKFAAPSRLIYSDYHLGGDRNPWNGCAKLFEQKSPWHPDNPLHGQKLQPVWLHGPKTLDGVKCARERLGVPGGILTQRHQYSLPRTPRVCRAGKE